jgi:D-alanyl-D-alanine carboxypeptidase
MRPQLGLATLAFVALATTLTPARANPFVVVDADSGQVLEAEEATRPWIPASTTKLMTVYVALKAIRDGRARLDSPLQVSALAARQRPVKMFLKPGQLITLDNALKIMLVKSANDLAYVIAEGIGGSVDDFAGMMNAEARRLGMANSHFVNPNGWDGPGQQSSARDLAILARALLREFPAYESYFGIGAVALGDKVMKNTNGLIGRYPGIEGMKTGFLCASGFNVVAVASRGGRRLVAVVLGAMSGAERTVKAARLLDAGFSSRDNLGTLEMLPASGQASAPNICEAVRHRGAPLSEESEAGLPMAENFHQDNANPAYAFLLQSVQAGPQTPMTMRNASGRIVLVPRAAFEPIPVYLGPNPGSSAPVLAARSAPPKAIATPGLPASAMALTDQGAPLPLSAPTGGAAAKSAARGKGHAISGARPSAAASIAPGRKIGKAAHGKAAHGKAAHDKAAPAKVAPARTSKAKAGKAATGKTAAGKAKAAAAARTQ